MKIAFAVFLLISCTAKTEERQIYSEVAIIPSLRELLQEQYGKDDTIKATVTTVNLDSDAEKEVVAFISGKNICGSGGCLLYVLKKNRDSYEQIAKLTVVRLPVQVFDERSNGWLDLGVRVQGGGINPGYDVRLRFNGQTYPSNPSVEPPADSNIGRVIISSSSSAKPIFE